MKVLFAGSPSFALPSLAAIERSSRHTLSGVLTMPDRPRGRGRAPRPTPVGEEAARLGLPILRPKNPSSPEVLGRIAALAPDVVAVVAYGRILRPSFLSLPPGGCVNVHASLLPAYRGAAPIERAILDGRKETGATTMMIDEGLDTGDILLAEAMEIGPEETAGELAARLAEAGAALLVRTLDLLARGACPREPQNPRRATGAPPIRKEEAEIVWEAPAERIVDLVRAMNPKPVARTATRRGALRVYRAVRVAGEGDAGVVLAADPKRGLIVAARGGAIRLAEIQLPGKRRMEDRALLSGSSFPVGSLLGGGG